ncbi:MAG: NAD(P)-binding domain-containing protein [Steroidobacterales bacterium]
MSDIPLDIAIIGAGPYGLSLAAHLQHHNKNFRIFGPAMRFWSHHMPAGTALKSEGFASNLYDPLGEFPLRVFCAQNGIPYADIGLPVKIEHFIAYGLEFRRRYVPNLEEVQVTALARDRDGFELTTDVGEQVRARKVIVATGIMNFAYLPPLIANLPRSLVSHSSDHGDLSGFKARDVAVLGAGASALDMAAMLHEAGAHVQLFARSSRIEFHDPPEEPRSLLKRIKAPRSGLGLGWRSRFCTDLPTVFHAMPQALRFRAVERHLGPAPCWFIRDAVEGRVAMHVGATLADARAAGQRLHLEFDQLGKADRKIVEVDHVVAGTGYKVALSRLGFLDPSIQSMIHTAGDTPVLNRYFESSVPGLFFIGVAAANSFGPMLRFAYGAKFAATRIARRIN